MANIDAKMALLQALIAGPAAGLELKAKIEERTKGKTVLSQGATYVALRSMENEGLVESYLGDEPIPERGGRPRRYFRLTAEGKRTALEDREAVQGLFGLPAKFRAVLVALLPKVSQ